jgi:hypothetical protein
MQTANFLRLNKYSTFVGPCMSNQNYALIFRTTLSSVFIGPCMFNQNYALTFRTILSSVGTSWALINLFNYFLVSIFHGFHFPKIYMVHPTFLLCKMALLLSTKELVKLKMMIFKKQSI